MVRSRNFPGRDRSGATEGLLFEQTMFSRLHFDRFLLAIAEQSCNSVPTQGRSTVDTEQVSLPCLRALIDLPYYDYAGFGPSAAAFTMDLAGASRPNPAAKLLAECQTIGQPDWALHRPFLDSH